MNGLKFCNDCGTMLRRKGTGMWCPKCRKLSPMEVRIDVKGAEERKPNALYVVDTPEDAVRKVARTCPECGNDEAYQWFSSVSGEHAGVRRERTVEHHRCTKCAHLWSESR